MDIGVIIVSLTLPVHLVIHVQPDRLGAGRLMVLYQLFSGPWLQSLSRALEQIDFANFNLGTRCRYQKVGSPFVFKYPVAGKVSGGLSGPCVGAILSLT